MASGVLIGQESPYQWCKFEALGQGEFFLFYNKRIQENSCGVKMGEEGQQIKIVDFRYDSTTKEAASAIDFWPKEEICLKACGDIYLKTDIDIETFTHSSKLDGVKSIEYGSLLVTATGHWVKVMVGQGGALEKNTFINLETMYENDSISEIASNDDYMVCEEWNITTWAGQEEIFLL